MCCAYVLCPMCWALRSPPSAHASPGPRGACVHQWASGPAGWVGAGGWVCVCGGEQASVCVPGGVPAPARHPGPGVPARISAAGGAEGRRGWTRARLVRATRPARPAHFTSPQAAPNTRAQTRTHLVLQANITPPPLKNPAADGQRGAPLRRRRHGPAGVRDHRRAAAYRHVHHAVRGPAHRAEEGGADDGAAGQVQEPVGEAVGRGQGRKGGGGSRTHVRLICL